MLQSYAKLTEEAYVMFCAKCGAEIPDDSVECPSCGAKVSGEAPAAGPGALSMLTLMIKADPILFLTMVGSLLIILGAFLPWVAETAYYESTLGIELSQGAAVLVVGVLLLAVLMLSRSGAAGAWGVIMVLLTALELAFIFQTLYSIKHIDAPTGAGFWVAMAGALIIAVSPLLARFGAAKK
jgi:hypothetical protein